MAPPPSSPLWKELARRTVGQQSPGGSSLVSLTRRTPRELGGTPQPSLEAEGRHPVSSNEMEGCYLLRTPRLLGKALSKLDVWSPGILFTVVSTGFGRERRWRELCACGLCSGWCG